MAENHRNSTAIVSDEDVLVEIAAKHVKKLARVIDDIDTRSSKRTGGLYQTHEENAMGTFRGSIPQVGRDIRERDDFARLVLKLPAEGLGKEMLSQQMVEKSQIDDIITG